MMVLVIGGSGSGKSSYAEETAVLLAGGSASMEENSRAESPLKKYYLAAMQVSDQEGERRVKRHRALRSGKGFLTIEQPVEIHRALEQMETGGRAALLECISNLTANEMFTPRGIRTMEQTAEQVINGIEQLRAQTDHLVVVSNNIFEEGGAYDKSVTDYIRAVGMINRKLAGWADRVVEVVAGIPVVIKQEPHQKLWERREKCRQSDPFL